MKSSIRDLLEPKEVERIFAEIKKNEIIEKEKYKPRTLGQSIFDNTKLLRSCIVPNAGEQAIVTDFPIRNLSIKYPVLMREKKEPIDAAHVVNRLMNSVYQDYKTLMMSVYSKLASKRVLENANIICDEDARLFLKNHVYSANSPVALSMLLCYDILSAGKAKKIEETNKTDEKNRRIVKVHSLDSTDNYDSVLIENGISISTYLHFPCKIEVLH